MFKRFTFVPLLVLIAGVIGWQGRTALWGCATAPHPSDRVRVDREDAVIVWDAATKTEHFIRRAEFDTDAKDFGFLVPTPSQPMLSEADGNVFYQLSEITKPEFRETIQQMKGPRPRPKKPSHRQDAAPGQVEVLEHKQVAGLDATVLRADDPDALGAWLREHDYPFRPELRDWINEYTKQSWFITAFKLGSAAQSSSQQAEYRLSSKVVRMSFQTEKPFYPYREPTDMRDEKQGAFGQRQLRLFVLAGERVGADHGGKLWHAPIQHAHPVTPERLQPAWSSLQLSLSADKTWWLTEFEDARSPRPGTDDIFFNERPNEGTVIRPPVITTIYRYEDDFAGLPTPPIETPQEQQSRQLWLWVAVILALLLAVSIYALARWLSGLRTSRRNPATSP